MSFNKTIAAEDIKKIGFDGEIEFGKLLSEHTTFKIGGAAFVFLFPRNVKSLCAAVKFAVERGLPYFVLGGGSNVVFADEGFSGVVISTKNLCGVSIDDAHSENDSAFTETGGGCFVRCGAGTFMADFVSFCTKNSISGAEEFAGLPGSVGGAVYMNARCFDKSVSDILFSIEYIDFRTANISKEISSGEKKTLPANIAPQVLPFSEGEWSYKISPFQNTRRIITSATFRLKNDSSRDVIAERCAHFVDERKKRGHFDAPSAGSVFKNNRSFGSPSGKLIDDAGLRGTQAGGAQIALWHGNFIINTGGATARDVRALVDLATEKVRERTGFTMETEIIFVENGKN